MIYIIILLSFFFFFFLLFYWFLKAPSRHTKDFQRKVLERLPNAQAKTQYLSSAKNISNISFVNKILSHIPIFNLFIDLLDKADIKTNPFVIILISLLLFASAFLIGSIFNLNFLLSLFLGIFLGILPTLFIKIKLENRRKSFEKNFVEALNIIKNALKSGQGLNSAIKLVSTDAPWPVDVEFKKVLAEMDYGFSFMDALNRLQRRIKLDELSFFIATVKIQAQTGGNLAKIIENIEEIIRTRFELKREIITLSAQGKMSGIILCSLPVIIVTVISILHPGFFDPLINNPTGQKALIVSIVLGLIGIFWIYKIVNIKI